MPAYAASPQCAAEAVASSSSRWESMTEALIFELMEGLLGCGVGFAFGSWVAAKTRAWLRPARRPRDASAYDAGPMAPVVTDSGRANHRPPLRDLAGITLRDLARPTRTKLVILAILFLGSIVAEREGYLVLGVPGDTAFEAENPVAVITMALFVRAVNLRVTLVIPESGGHFTHQLPPK